MTALLASEVIRDAIKTLQDAKAIGWPCEAWTQAAVRHVARNCDIRCPNASIDDEYDADPTFVADDTAHGHECDGWDRYQTGPAISMLISTIDAQIAVLSAVLPEVLLTEYAGAPTAGPAINLALTIMGFGEVN